MLTGAARRRVLGQGISWRSSWVGLPGSTGEWAELPIEEGFLGKLETVPGPEEVRRLNRPGKLTGAAGVGEGRRRENVPGAATG